jgi:NAD(P)-dependent dehydrogenase (short-subunit alcohol dehydrogenase family)
LERSEQRRIIEGGTWVVTGGARGVTAVAALAVGQRFGLRLHLLGTSPPPQIEDSWRNLSKEDLQELKTTISRQAHDKGQSPRQAWKQVEKAIEIDRSLRSFREAGVRATYHCCDVRDRGQLSEVLDRIRESDGPIEGIIHGAGIAVDARFENKKRENVLNTIMTKVGGAANLIALTAADPLRFFVGFGSVAGRFGAKGQSDYAAANDMLCKQIGQLRMQRPDCVALGIHWHAWDEVGMAVQPDVKAIFDGRDYRLMPTREGVAHLIDELTMGGTEAEVTFTEVPQLSKRRRPSNESPLAGAAGAGSD